MRNRLLLVALLLVGTVIPITSCNSSPSLTSIVVSPGSMNFGGPGLTTQLTATGYYTHPNHPAIAKDITNQVNWASATPDCVAVSSTGLITSGYNACSNILITASMQGFNGLISGTMTVNVTQSSSGSGGTTTVDATSITIIPGSTTVATIGATTQFIAIGHMSDGTTVDLTNLAKWNSSNSAIATINGTGLATAVSSGSSTISAIYTNVDGTAASGTATMTVAPAGSPEPLVAVSISPVSQTVLGLGQTAQYIAIGTTGSGTTTNLTNSVTWTVSSSSVASINASGLATANGSGTTAITAIATNPDGTVVTGTASLTVSIPTNQETYVSVVVVPDTQTVATGNTVQYLAIATKGDGTTVDVTQTATWRSSVVGVATMSADGATGGLATAVSAGTSAITAEVSNPDGTAVTGVSLLTVN